MIKRLLIKISIVWISIVILMLIGVSYYQGIINKPFTNISSNEQLTIKSGDTLYSIIDNLNSKDKIKNSFITKYYIRNKSLKVSLKPGVCEINKDMSINAFVEALSNIKAESDPNIVKVTFPEGYELDQIADLLGQKGLISKQEFIKSCVAYPLPSFITKDTNRKYQLEGYLYPDTYEFKKGITGDKIIETMLNRFTEEIKVIKSTNGLQLSDNNIDKAIIMASIVEREAKASEERKVVASVFFNRIEKKMKLQSCATVVYAYDLLGTHKEKLYDKDLEINSPYNTYKVPALPEGPICSPGKAAIEAALMPDNTNYLYFVSKNDGTHVFSTNEKDHLAAAQKYQSGK